MTRRLIETPEPPYYAVIFTSRLSQTPEGYAEMAEEMDRLAKSQPGYLGRELARGENGVGITVSYWQDEAAIRSWKAVAKHRLAQKIGNERWYEEYELRVAKVERAYSGPRTVEDIKTEV